MSEPGTTDGPSLDIPEWMRTPRPEPSPMEAYQQACLEYRAATRDFEMAKERLRLATLACEQLEEPNAES